MNSDVTNRREIFFFPLTYYLLLKRYEWSMAM